MVQSVAKACLIEMLLPGHSRCQPILDTATRALLLQGIRRSPLQRASQLSAPSPRAPCPDTVPAGRLVNHEPLRRFVQDARMRVRALVRRAERSALCSASPHAHHHPRGSHGNPIFADMEKFHAGRNDSSKRFSVCLAQSSCELVPRSVQT
jgi:hypothetical protein